MRNSFDGYDNRFGMNPEDRFPGGEGREFREGGMFPRGRNHHPPFGPGEGGPRRPHGGRGMGGEFRTLPEGVDGGEFRTLPEGPHGGGFRTLPEGPRGGHGMPGRPGFPPHGMPPFGGMPPHGGRVPRRPAPTLPQQRIDEASLTELIDMAGRLMHHRPEVGQARGQNLILSILAGREALSQRELQQMLGIQPGSLSELLSKLEAKGLLAREKAEDRRGNVLRITDAGRLALPRGGEQPEDALFDALTDDEQVQLTALLRRLVTQWNRRPDDERPLPPDCATV